MGCAILFTVKNAKQPLIFQKVTYLVTRRIDQIDPKTWLILESLNPLKERVSTNPNGD